MPATRSLSIRPQLVPSDYPQFPQAKAAGATASQLCSCQQPGTCFSNWGLTTTAQADLSHTPVQLPHRAPPQALAARAVCKPASPVLAYGVPASNKSPFCTLLIYLTISVQAELRYLASHLGVIATQAQVGGVACVWHTNCQLPHLA